MPGRTMDVTAIDPASAEVAAALEAAFERGRAAQPAVPLPRLLFDREVTARVRRRLTGGAGGESGDALAGAIGRLAAEDLYLALACDAGVPGAWERLDARHRPRLCAQARRLGADGGLADDVAAEVFAELCAPAGAAGARTRLSRYDGTGSLDAWLGIIVRHRLLDRRRSRGAAAAEGADADVPPRDSVDPRAESPAAAAIARESAERFAGCVRDAFARLTPKESLAVQFRFADDLPQRRIAGLLGVGEPRVSRLVHAAIEKLRGWMERCWRALVPESGGERPLAELLREVMVARRELPGGDRP